MSVLVVLARDRTVSSSGHVEMTTAASSPCYSTTNPAAPPGTIQPGNPGSPNPVIQPGFGAPGTIQPGDPGTNPNLN